MYTQKLIIDDTFYLGSSDRRLELFENVYPIPNGVSYNSYIILDEKTCLLDTVDKSIEDVFFKKLEEILGDKKLDYVVINHMECDHSASLSRVLEKYPDVQVVLTNKAKEMFFNFEGFELKNPLIVKEGDSLTLGKHNLTFLMAPMVHWPEVMVTYDNFTKTLFSADAFGTFGTLDGNIFTNKDDFKEKFLDDARRYYTNIVGKYGLQVQGLLKKASKVEIKNICPLHGPIWKEDLDYIISYYDKWSKYESEINGVLIVYGSVYGHSEIAANVIADELAELGIKNIKIYDSSKTDKSYLVSESFKYSHLVICASTYNLGIFTPLEEYLLDLKYHGLQNRVVAIVENGSWAPQSMKLSKEIFSQMKNMNVLDESFSFTSSLKDKDMDNVKKLVLKIKETLGE